MGYRLPTLILTFCLACSSGAGNGDSHLPDIPESPDHVGETGPDLAGYPDPAFVYKLDGPEKVKAGQKYAADEPTLYRTVEKLPVLDVRAMAFTAGTLWVGTAKGLYRYAESDDRFDPVTLGVEADLEPVVDLSRRALDDGRIVVLQPGRVHLLNPGTGETVTYVSTGPDFSAAEAGGEEAWVGTADSGLWRVDLDSSEGELNVDPVPGLEGLPAIRDLAVDDQDRVWMATAAGLRIWDTQTLTPLNAAEGFLPDDDVRAIGEGTGAMVAGTATGMAWVTEGGAVVVPAGIDGLPADDLTDLAVGDGLHAAGHGRGATTFTFTPQAAKVVDQVQHYVSQRWLPADPVRAVAFDGQGRAWIGTSAGLTRIDWVDRTLAETMDAHEKLLEDHFWRMNGFVGSDVTTDDPWAPTQWYGYDHDNDGLWTQMQIGAWCYAYAATGDEQYYQKARKAMDVMFLQIDIPAVDFEAAGLGRGFVTRSLVRDDEGAIYEDKKDRPNWHLVHWTDGHDYYWKDDTSSDETTGHFFGYPLFYDLCAKDDGEKAAVAEHAGALAGYIADNGFRLLDLDGIVTGHGHWQPERIAAAADGMDVCIAKFLDAGEPEKAIEWCGDSRYGGGWLNSIEILGHMLAAWHMTGDPKFYDAYDELITVHKYDVMAMAHEETFTVTNPSFMNHSDHELAMLGYHTLIRYEPNEHRRQKWIESLLFLYEWEKIERNPLWAAFTVLLAGPEHVELDAALQSLREMPLDRRVWTVDNSHRKDALDWPADRFDDAQWDRVFPYDEIRTIWWNGNFHVKVDGGDGRRVSGPMAWLLPYWAFRYAGVIGP